MQIAQTGQMDQYQTYQTLGKGATAKVKRAIDSSNGKEVALKIFDKRKNADIAVKRLTAEVEQYKNLSHPYMINLLGQNAHSDWAKSGSKTVPVAYCVLELIKGGELFDYVVQSRFSEEICRFYFKQALNILNYMHNNGVAHRDLKPENIMLDDDYNLKVTDFGFAAPTEGRTGTGFLKTPLGTPGYKAPEICERRPYSGASVDLFALGVIMFILYSGHPPFANAKSGDAHYNHFINENYDAFWAQHQKSKPKDFFSDDFKDLITQMLQYDASSRLSMADLAAHSWVQNGKEATKEEIRADFCKRLENIKKDQQAAIAEQREKKAKKKPHRADGEIEPDMPIFDGSVVSKKPYKVSYRNGFDIMNDLKNYMDTNELQYEAKDEKGKITYEFLDGKPDEDDDVNGFRCEVRLYKDKDEDDARIVEFNRIEGDHLLFAEHVKEIDNDIEF